MPIAKVSRQENISNVTLVAKKGVVVPDSQPPEQWSAEGKLASGRNTRFFRSRTEGILPEKGLFPEKVKAWKDAFLNGQRPAAKPSKAELKAAAKEALLDKKEIHKKRVAA